MTDMATTTTTDLDTITDLALAHGWGDTAGEFTDDDHDTYSVWYELNDLVSITVDFDGHTGAFIIAQLDVDTFDRGIVTTPLPTMIALIVRMAYHTDLD